MAWLGGRYGVTISLLVDDQVPRFTALNVPLRENPSKKIEKHSIMGVLWGQQSGKNA